MSELTIVAAQAGEKGCGTAPGFFFNTVKLDIVKCFAFAICVIFISGCDPHDEKSINLGQKYILIRLHGEVSIEDFATTNNYQVPPNVVSMGNTEKFIVAYSVVAGATNIWIVVKDTRTIIGPLDRLQYSTCCRTNHDLDNIQQTNIWLY